MFEPRCFIAGKSTGSHTNCLPCYKWQKIYQVFPVVPTKDANDGFHLIILHEQIQLNFCATLLLLLLFIVVDEFLPLKSLASYPLM